MAGTTISFSQTALSDPEVAAVAVAANQIDIKYAEIAKKKSKNAEILNFAETMAKDHNAVNVINAAMEIVDVIKEQQLSSDSGFFDIRIGIHTGPLVAGVVGHKKFAYDIWGDTVNTAARMEQNSEANRINISHSTYELVKDKFHCSFRGKQPAKNKGLIEMYFVDAKK